MERLRRLRTEGDHENAYKRRSGVGIDKKMLRLHQRSMDQQTKRAEKIGQKRNIGNLSPLKEVNQNVKKVEQPAKEPSRKERLEKWRQEKELKKKLDARHKKAPVFKVHHVKETLAPSFSAKSKTSKDTTQKTVPTATRVTRQSTRLQAQQPKPETRKPAATTKKSSKAKPVVKKETAEKPKTIETEVKKVEEKPTEESFASFAPVNFTFTAPESLPAVPFKPLSPSSAQSFLFPTMKDGGSYLSTPDRRRCSTPKMKPTIPSLSHMTSSSESTSESEPMHTGTPKRARRKSTKAEPTSESETTAVVHKNPRTRRSVATSSSENDEVSNAESTTRLRRKSRRSVAPVAVDSESAFVETEGSSDQQEHEEKTGNASEQVVEQLKATTPVAPVSAVFRTPVSAPRRSIAARSSAKRPLTSVARTPKVAMRYQSMSPEEKMEVITHSPMVETRRRTPKLTSPEKPVAPLPIEFDDVAGPIPMDLTESETQQPAPTDPQTEEHDVMYFRNLLVSETARLNVLCENWEKNMAENENLPEDVTGQIRTTIGQAQLLMRQRFKQFSGLVDNCEFGTGEKETHCSDLQGFWDMIFFQVEDVDKKFSDLDTLKARNWVKDEPKKVVKKKKVASKPVATKQAAAKPAVKSGKSKFAAFRAQMMKQKKAGEEGEKTVMEVTEEVKTFEAPGFFKVSSPVKTPKKHCEVGTTGSPLRKAVLEKSARRSLGKLTPGLSTSRRSCGASPLLKTALITLSASRGSNQSPLVKGATPAKKPAVNGSAFNTPVSAFEGASIFTPDSLERPGAEATALDESVPQIVVEAQPTLTANNSFSKYLMPSTSSQSAAVETDLNTSKDALRGVRRTPRRASAIMKTPKSSAARLRRSVHFLASPSLDATNSPTLKAPRTPFNFDKSSDMTCTPRPRLIDINTDFLFTPPPAENTPTSLMADLNVNGTPSALLFTPPQPAASKTESGSDDLTDLMCFSPIAANSRRSVRLSRQSVADPNSLI